MGYKDPEKVKAYSIKYYSEHREERKAASIKYYAEHRHERRAYGDKYREEHYEKVRARETKYYEEHREKRNSDSVKYHANIKKKVFEHYGMKCACCGEDNLAFLTIDHINNDGATHRKEVLACRLYNWLIKNNFPDGFQTLCYNCNCGRAHNGGICPHMEIVRINDKIESGLWHLPVSVGSK